MKNTRLAMFLTALVVALLTMNISLFANNHNNDSIILGDGLINTHFNGNATAVLPFLIPSIYCNGGYCYLANGSASGTGHLQSNGTYQIYSASSAPFFVTHQADGTFRVTQTSTMFFNYTSQQGTLTGTIAFGSIAPTSNQLIYTITATLTNPGGCFGRYFPDGGKVSITMEVTFPLTSLTTVNGFAAAEFQNGTVTPASHCGNYTHNYWGQHPSQWQHGNGLTIGGQQYSDNQVQALLQQSEYGDASMYLVHRLIGAMLNIGNGTKQDPVQTFIDDANNLLLNTQLPLGTNPNSPLGQQMLGDGVMLDSYNNNNVTTASAQ
jgi:hypothetical protein